MSSHLSADVRTCPQMSASTAATVDAREVSHRAGCEVTASGSARDHSRLCLDHAGHGGVQAEFACLHGQRAPGSASPGRRGTPSVRGGDAWGPATLASLTQWCAPARSFCAARTFGHPGLSAPGAYGVCHCCRSSYGVGRDAGAALVGSTRPGE
jgi:hypothetical protein